MAGPFCGRLLSGSKTSFVLNGGLTPPAPSGLARLRDLRYDLSWGTSLSLGLLTPASTYGNDLFI